MRYAVGERSAMNAHDWFDISNWWIGAAGLLLTVATLFFAKGARKAAIEAREAIWKRGASEALSELERISKELILYLSAERYKEASVRLLDLMERMPLVRERFKGFLRGDFDKLKKVESSLQQLATKLRTPASLEDEESISAMIETASQANTDLQEVCGRLLAKLDKEER
jgi:flagellin-specific chaperone FliS